MATIRVEADTTRIDCPNCAKTAEEEIKRIDGIVGARIDLLNSRISYSYDDSTVDGAALKHRIEKLGHFTFIEPEKQNTKTLPFSRSLLLLMSISLMLTIVGVLARYVFNLELASRIIFYLAIGVGGWSIFVKAVVGLRHRRVDMNALMSIAVIGAVGIGTLDEALAVVLLFGAANLLESFSLWKLSKSLTRFTDVAGGHALLKQGDSTLAVSPESLKIDDIVVIKEGMKIPADGVVVRGESSIDLSTLTGEAEPEAVTVGSLLYGSSINLDGYLEMRVTATVKDSRIGKILQLVGDASARKAKVERLVDRFAHIYTPAVVVLAGLIAIAPPLLLDASFGVWFYKALVFLVISCPCALVISTPVTVTTALAAASRLKAVIKGGDALERLARIDTIAFDKTGTLTSGQQQFESVICYDGKGEIDVLQIAASLEQISNHPTALAISAAAATRHLSLLRVENHRAVAGVGVEGEIDGVVYRLGGKRILSDIETPQPHNRAGSFLTSDKRLLAAFLFTDQIRPESADTVSRLRNNGFKSIGILSGDRQEQVDKVADALKLDFAHGALMPDEKYERIVGLGDHVAMVGDGINDVVALSGSDVAIAVGRIGNDIPIQYSDIVLFGNSVANLPQLFGLGKRALAIIKFNIAFAIGIKLIFLALAAGGIATMWMAVVADMGTSLLVIFNSLQLLKR
jgi:Cd2+/Zn2+-exporting ATPase